MPRLWFKKAMRNAILLGVKSSTSRTHALKVGVSYDAVSGSRFKAEKFAQIRIDSCTPMPLRQIIDQHYKEEGFNSPKDAWMFISKELPQYNSADLMYYHQFTVEATS